MIIVANWEIAVVDMAADMAAADIEIDVADTVVAVAVAEIVLDTAAAFVAHFVVSEAHPDDIRDTDSA